MRKLIVLAFIICFVGSASAAEVTYHFTAEIVPDTYLDGTEIFSEMGYSADMQLKGTFVIDPEIVGITNGVPSEPGAWGFWTTGIIMFENQGYSWLDSCSRNVFIQNATTDRVVKILTKQGDPNSNQDNPEMMQVITLTYDGLDANMPSDFPLGDAPTFVFQITKAGGLISSINANITAIMTEEEYANSIAQKARTAAFDAEATVDNTCPCDGDWKNHGAYVRCVTKAARDLVKEGSISKKEKGVIVSEAAKSTCGKKDKNKNKKKKKK